MALCTAQRKGQIAVYGATHCGLTPQVLNCFEENKWVWVSWWLPDRDSMQTVEIHPKGRQEFPNFEYAQSIMTTDDLARTGVGGTKALFVNLSFFGLAKWKFAMGYRNVDMIIEKPKFETESQAIGQKCFSQRLSKPPTANSKGTDRLFLNLANTLAVKVPCVDFSFKVMGISTTCATSKMYDDNNANMLLSFSKTIKHVNSLRPCDAYMRQ